MTWTWIMMFLGLIGAFGCLCGVADAADKGRPGVALFWAITFGINLGGFALNLATLVQATS